MQIQIRKEEQTLSSEIFQLAPFPMWIYDLETLDFLDVNEEAERQYGYSKKEFLSMTIRDIRPKKELGNLEKAIGKLRNSHSKFTEGMYLHQKKDGTTLNVKIKGSYFDYKGRDAELVAAIDLSSRFEQEQKIEAQNRFLETIGKVSEEFVKSKDWRRSLKTCFNFIGNTYPFQELVFLKKDKAKNTLTLEAEWKRKEISLGKFNPATVDINLLQKELDFSEFGKPIVLKNPEGYGIFDLRPGFENMSVLMVALGSVESISGLILGWKTNDDLPWTEWEEGLSKNLANALSHVLAEADGQMRLARSEAKFKALVQNAYDMIAVIDDEGNYKYIAPASEKVLGLKPEDLQGRNAFEFIHPEDAPRLMKHLEEALQGKDVSIHPYRFLDGFGKYIWIQTEVRNHLDDPDIQGIVANTKDVTQEIEKMRAQELVEDLTQAMLKPESLEESLNQVLNKLVNNPKIDAAEVWMVSLDQHQLNLFSKSIQEKSLLEFYNALSYDDYFEKGKGLPGNTWAKGKTLVWGNLEAQPSFTRTKEAKSVGLKTGIGIPVFYQGEFLACFTCFSKSEEIELQEVIPLLSEVSNQMGLIIRHKLTEIEFQSFYDLSPDPHCLIGFDGLVKKYNNAFHKLMGYDEGELLGKPILSFLNPSDLDGVKERISMAVQQAKAPDPNYKKRPIEIRLTTKSGQELWLSWQGESVPQAKLFIAVAKDITEQKQAEIELEMAYERLKSAQKMAKLGYWLRDAGSEIYEWGEETFKIYGLDSKSFNPTKESVTRTVHPEDQHLFEEDFTRSFKSSKVHTIEHRIITSSDEIRWVRQEIKLRQDPEGNPVQLMGTIQDITQQKESELNLRLSNERFVLAMKASNEIIWEVDHTSNKVIRGIEEGANMKYKVAEAFSMSNSWFQRVEKNDRQEVWDSLNEALKNPNLDFWRMEYEIILNDGSTGFFIDRCYILRDENGNPVRSVGTALDVTESRRQLRKIQNQNDKLQEISWLQSHVIRAPLARILGLINVVNMNSDNRSGKDQELFNLIAHSAKELDQVIHEINNKTSLIEESHE